MTRRSDPSLPAYLNTPLGKVIRAWRLARGLTLEDLAARMGSGMSRGYLSQLENDKIHTPSEEKLAQLAEALGIAPLMLVTRTFPDTELPNTLPAAEADPTAPVGIQGEAAPHSDVDLSRLTAVLSRVPTSRQQQYVDALAALVEHLTGGEAEEKA